MQATVPPGDSASDAWGPVRVEKMSRIRRTIAEQMARSAATIPHVTNFDDADVTELERLRQGVPAGQLSQNIKLTMMPFVMKAVAMVLRRHAALNAVFDEPNEQIVYKDYVNLGIAVDTPRGLVVPNVRNADRLTILQLAQALGSIAERARGSQFGIDDLRGGTFTISNLGAVGGIVQHADHQLSGSGHLALGPGALAAGGAWREPRPHRIPADDASEPLVRPSSGRRGHGRPVPQRSHS